MSTLYLHAQHRYLVAPESDLRAPLQALGIDMRRVSRLTRLALLATHPLTLSPQGKLFLTSPFASPSIFARHFPALLYDSLPSPLDFMANLHNAAAFHIAQHKHCHGGSLFLASDAATCWQALWLAGNDLLATDSEDALVCWLYEAPPDADAAILEGGIAWHIGRTPHADSLARLHFCHDHARSADAASSFLAAVDTASKRIADGETLILPAPFATRVTPHTLATRDDDSFLPR